ncbi:MAG: hypothetical protein K0R39_2921 [Symbiobacteriaceae bacterium]|nr:hypothetical protein [Symbiobacteriaceae bacterium]
MLTIAQFADRTGISPSALRFYERKGLLMPTQRLPNGYRVYAPDQVADAQLINSLRQADVSVAAIREFLRFDREGRARLIAQWQKEVTARLLTIRMAGQYLHGMGPDQPPIHLHRWEEPSLLIWFPALGPAGPLPFVQAVAQRTQEADRLRLPVLSGGYVRSLDVIGGRISGEVGFRVTGKKGLKLPTDARVQEVPPTLFATIECYVDDDKSAHRVFRFMQQFGYQALGLSLERYIPGESDRYQLLIAVTV